MQLGDQLSPSACATPRDRLGAEADGAEHRLQRGGAPGHPHRPRLPRRPLLRARRGAARAACAWRACSATSPISPTTRWRRSSAAGCARRTCKLQLRRRVRDRVLPALPGRQVRRLLRRQHLSADHQGARLLRPGARLRRQLAAALARAKAKFLVVSFSTDWRFSPERSREIVYGAGAQPARRELRRDRVDAGHDSFLLDDPHYHAVLRAYFDNISHEGDMNAQDIRIDFDVIASWVSPARAYSTSAAATARCCAT
jgi:hypothetical protein